jgi:hypothetical protein
MRLTFEQWMEVHGAVAEAEWFRGGCQGTKGKYLAAAYRVYWLEWEEDRDVVQVFAVIALFGCVALAFWPKFFRWVIGWFEPLTAGVGG